MLRSCAKCGKIHEASFKCTKDKRVYVKTEERRLRSTNKWKEKSLEIRERANYLCEVCRDKGQYNYNNLEVHHIEKITDSPNLLLDNNNLICLCVEHHKEADEGGIDKNYLRKLAKKREATL